VDARKHNGIIVPLRQARPRHDVLAGNFEFKYLSVILSVFSLFSLSSSTLLSFPLSLSLSPSLFGPLGPSAYRSAGGVPAQSSLDARLAFSFSALLRPRAPPRVDSRHI